MCQNFIGIVTIKFRSMKTATGKVSRDGKRFRHTKPIDTTESHLKPLQQTEVRFSPPARMTELDDILRSGIEKVKKSRKNSGSFDVRRK